MLADSEGRDGRWEVHRYFVATRMIWGSERVPDGVCVSQRTGVLRLRSAFASLRSGGQCLGCSFFAPFVFLKTCGQGQSGRAMLGVSCGGGTNEFGIWGGYSPFSFVLKGTSKDRELLLVNLQYARTLIATRPFKLKYTADIVPLALEFQPTQRYVVDGALLTNPVLPSMGRVRIRSACRQTSERRKFNPW